MYVCLSTRTTFNLLDVGLCVMLPLCANDNHIAPGKVENCSCGLMCRAGTRCRMPHYVGSVLSPKISATRLFPIICWRLAGWAGPSRLSGKQRYFSATFPSAPDPRLGVFSKTQFRVHCEAGRLRARYICTGVCAETPKPRERAASRVYVTLGVFCASCFCLLPLA